MDIAIVGAGAAGLMTAITAGRENLKSKQPLAIHLFDSRPKVGAKILMSGGTRCNVTNKAVTPSDYCGAPRHFIQHVLEAFTPAATIQFFEEIGVPLVLEPTGKYFPATHSGKTVLEALLKEADRVGVTLHTGAKIESAKKSGDFFEFSKMRARRLVLTTGGLSYPETGSDGTGLAIAKSFGHTIVPTTPALTPLLTDEEDWKSLSGVSLDVELTFFELGKKKAQSRGAFLFTHFGFSGPAALDISRYWAGASLESEPKIFVNFLPQGEDSLLPKRFVKVFESRCSKRGFKNPRRMLLHYPLEVSGVYGYKKAEVTAGGVDLLEVNVATMESKKVPGLYFSGEILNADGRIGGFNFQWAWSTGAIAGRGLFC